MEVSPGCTGGVTSSYTISNIATESHPELKKNFESLIGETLNIKLENNTAGDLYVSTGATAYSASGERDSNVMLNSSHHYYVRNDTNKVQDIKIEIKLATHDDHHTNEEKCLRLKPGDNIYGSVNLNLSYFYPEAGYYHVHALTTISAMKDLFVTDIVKSSAIDSNIVTIK